MHVQLNLFSYLQRAAQCWPEKLAFSDEATGYSFGSLLAAAESQGTALADAYGCVNRPVAVGVDRTADTIAAFMGVLASGNHYVAIDLSMPEARMERILRQVQPVCFLVPQAQLEKLTGLNAVCPVVPFRFSGSRDGALLCRARAQVLDIDPAYILYTSGSTGMPKGIVISHRGVIDFTEWLADTCCFTSADCFANQAPYYFDLSVKDLYQTLRNGATCYILPKKYFLFPKLLLQFMQDKQITAIAWATSAFHLVANSGVLRHIAPTHLRTAVLGGEALLAKQLNAWREAAPQATFVNTYGPTEVTVDCCYYIVDREFADHEPIPIGQACENMQVLLLDASGQPVAPGQPGEICVRGAGLARGYFDDPEKTARSFIQNPENPHYPDLLYRTGDIGVRGEDGLLYFRNRADGQIKHMGYRIELGEIETALNALPGLEEAICLFDRTRDKLLVCYSGSLSPQELVRAAASLLPKYMLPNICHQLDGLPHNANGKIDRAALRRRYLDAATD